MRSVLTNARLVLPGAVVRGAVAFGRAIERVGGQFDPSGLFDCPVIDCQGDFVLPGAVDLHTDNLERQVQPRQKTRWPSRSAMIMHDAHCAAAGVTTVFDSLCVGDLGFDEDRHRTYVEGAADLQALHDVLRVEHFLHLRCELPATDMLAKLAVALHHPGLRMVSLMDHTPGYGQYADVARYRVMRLGDGERAEVTEQRIAVLAAQRAAMREANRAALLTLLAGLPVVLASHDDRTASEVAENIALGIGIAEFPVSLEAAQVARSGGQGIIAGAPNVVRGGSHTGNVAVRDLVRAGLVDALASDYVPASLVEAAFALAAAGDLELCDAAGLISAAPAAMAGFSDRGRIVPGLRADLVRVRLVDGLPVVVATWCAGVRVF